MITERNKQPLATKKTDPFRRFIMGCLCNIFDGNTLTWVIVIILLLLILNCTCCGG